MPLKKILKIRFLVHLISILVPLFMNNPAYAGGHSQRFHRPYAGWTEWNLNPEYSFKGQYGIAGDPSIIKINNQYVMYYGCFDPIRKPQGTDICVTVSNDGFKWILPDTGNKAILGQVMIPNEKSWHTANETPYAVNFKGKLLLYFTGYKDQGGIIKSAPAPLGVATTTNGLNFTSTESPIIVTDKDNYDQSGIVSPSVVQDNNSLYMVYAAHCYTATCNPQAGSALMLAESTDGIKWTKRNRLLLDKNTILPSFVNGLYQMAEPELIKGPDGNFYLFFTALQANSHHMIGVAMSKKIDGPWIFNPKPIVTVQGTETEVVAPNVIIENNKARMWYSVFTGSGINIRYAESPWPIFVRSNQER